MPTYEYRCKSCAREFEIVQSFSDDALSTCEECGGPLRKLFGNVGISFKGDGFYKNDHGANAKSAPSESAPSSTSSNGDSSSSGSSSGGASSDTKKSDSSSSSTSDSGGSSSSKAASV